jgi:uroporphyrinogen decarboxylase
MRKPDFTRFRKVLLLQGEPDFVPLFDGVDIQVKKAFLGKPVTGLTEEVEFATEAGYDYVHFMTGLRPWWNSLSLSAKGQIFKGGKAKYSAYSETEQERGWAPEGQGVITSIKHCEEFEWPNMTVFDFSSLDEMQNSLPPSMKVIATIDGFYTPVWLLMGGETFFIALIQNPELIDRMFEKVGAIQFALIEKVLSYDVVGALRISDDIAYNTGTIVSPKYLHKYFFPRLKQVGDLCKKRNLPFIYHSDGNLNSVLDDIIDAGVNGLHPIQPNAMDISVLKKKVSGKLCLMGNIDMDIMTRKTPDDVKELVFKNLRAIAPGGGYILGASNSVPEYIPLKNYNAMRETALEYGQYPISL